MELGMSFRKWWASIATKKQKKNLLRGLGWQEQNDRIKKVASMTFETMRENLGKEDFNRIQSYFNRTAARDLRELKNSVPILA